MSFSTHALAAKAVSDVFYVDDGVTGADSVKGAIELYRQLQSLFSIAGFLLRKWNSSEPTVLCASSQIPKRNTPRPLE